MYVCPDLINIGFGAHHPVDGKIYQILPVDLSLGDVIPSRTHAKSMALVNILSNPSIAGGYMRKFPLLPKLLQHRRPQVASILPYGNNLITKFRGVRVPPLTWMNNSTGPCSIGRANRRTVGGDIIHRIHGRQALLR